MSLRSCALFRKEKLFYDLLAEQPHPNLAQRLQSKHSAMILQCYQPLELVWSKQSKDTRFEWILQLLSALEWLENLGYTHGDLRIRNMGIDINNQLWLFDFGSTMQRSQEGFHGQVLRDHFSVATCIHYLASGEDLVAKAISLHRSENDAGDAPKRPRYC
jgi:RIO-like serine/threonine protein kinase